MTTTATRNQALARDDASEFTSVKNRFFKPEDTIYMDGNSLGLLSDAAEQSVFDALNQWKTLGIEGWLAADPPWFYLGEELGKRMASLVGAETDEVVVTGGTTVNLHALVSTFYNPTPERRKILINELDFPSDVYALQAQIRNAGGDPDRDLVKAPSHDGRTIDDEDIVAAMTSDVALALLPSVLYRSGQLFDIERMTAEAHARGILIGWDCAHSVGAMPHAFDDWGIDFAFWCNYKYLNAGPGSIGALYVNRRHFDRNPALPGWWGYNKDRQFDMVHEWESSQNAGAWQISTISLLSAAPLLGSLKIFDEVGIENVRRHSLQLTDYLIELIESRGLLREPYNYTIGTPRDHSQRGGHVAIEHDAGPQISGALKARGVVPDFRAPNVVRLAPIALYTRFVDIWDTAEHLKAVIDGGEYQSQSGSRDVVA